MTHPPATMPRVLEASCEALAGTVPALVAEVRAAFENPDYFQTLAYGAGRQVLADMSMRGRVDYLTLVLDLYEDKDTELLPDMEVHHASMVLQVFGILSPVQMNRLSGANLGALRSVTQRPKPVRIRLGGAIEGEHLRPLLDVLRYKLAHDEWDWAALRNLRDSGVSITVLSRIIGLGAQRISRWFNRTPANAQPLIEGWEAPAKMSAEPVAKEVTEPTVETKENHSADHPDSGVPGEAGTVLAGPLPVHKPSSLTYDVPPVHSLDDPRLHGDRPWVHIRDGRAKLSTFGFLHYKRLVEAGQSEVTAGSGRHADVADQSIQAG